MSEEASVQSTTVPVTTEPSVARLDAAEVDQKGAEGATNTNKERKDMTIVSDVKDTNVSAENIEATQDSTNTTEEIAVKSTQDTEMDKKTEADDANTAPDATATGEGAADPATATPASISKSKARRKSAGVPEHKNKKLNKKASKAKMAHTDAKPGEYYFIKLKGYPLWPGIICDEEILPANLKNNRPVTASRADGTYREDYEDGGKKVLERTFPVMYLYTNEFGWIPNYDLVDLDLEDVGNVDSKMRKDLYQAHMLAAEKHDLDYFKQVLREFEEAKAAENEAKAAAEEAKAAAKAAKEANKSASKTKKKAKNSAEVDEDNEDVEMADAEGELVVDGEGSEKKPKSSKKRKAVADPEETTTPQASGTKKLKFKPITSSSTPKAANGATPKSSKKDSAAKPAKSKSKKSTTNGTAEKNVPVTPKEPELSPEEKRVKKEKEILFLRHKLQKGLLTRDQQPKEEEMKQMSEFITKLEGYADLEVSIIRATKINKVLKAILKLAEIPKESEFQFKDRSKSLLEKWNKILEGAEQPAASVTPAPGDDASKDLANGISKGHKSGEKHENDDKEEGKSKESTADVDTVTKEHAEESKGTDNSIKPSTTESAPVEAAA